MRNSLPPQCVVNIYRLTALQIDDTQHSLRRGVEHGTKHFVRDISERKGKSPGLRSSVFGDKLIRRTFQIDFTAIRFIGKNHGLVVIVIPTVGQCNFINTRFAGINAQRSLAIDIGGLGMSEAYPVGIVNINLRNSRVEAHHLQSIAAHIEGKSVTHLVGHERNPVAPCRRIGARNRQLQSMRRRQYTQRDSRFLERKFFRFENRSGLCKYSREWCYRIPLPRIHGDKVSAFGIIGIEDMVYADTLATIRAQIRHTKEIPPHIFLIRKLGTSIHQRFQIILSQQKALPYIGLFGIYGQSRR